MTLDVAARRASGGAAVRRGYEPENEEFDETLNRGWHEYMTGARTGDQSVDTRMRSKPGDTADDMEISKGKFGKLGGRTDFDPEPQGLADGGTAEQLDTLDNIPGVPMRNAQAVRTLPMAPTEDEAPLPPVQRDAPSSEPPPPESSGSKIASGITQARQAGFSDADIWTHLKASKTWGPRLTAAGQAGFSDADAQKYLGLTLDQPGLLQRAGRAIGRMATALPSEAAGTAPEAIAAPALTEPVGKVLSTARDAFGSEALGLTDKTAAALQRAGVFPDPNGGLQPLKQINEAIVRPVAAMADAFARATGSGFVAAQQAAIEAGMALGLTDMQARTIASMPEAFLGSPGEMHVPTRPGGYGADVRSLREEAMNPEGWINRDWEGNREPWHDYQPPRIALPSPEGKRAAPAGGEAPAPQSGLSEPRPEAAAPPATEKPVTRQPQRWEDVALQELEPHEQTETAKGAVKDFAEAAASEGVELPTVTVTARRPEAAPEAPSPTAETTIPPSDDLTYETTQGEMGIRKRRLQTYTLEVNPRSNRIMVRDDHADGQVAGSGYATVDDAVRAFEPQDMQRIGVPLTAQGPVAPVPAPERPAPASAETAETAAKSPEINQTEAEIGVTEPSPISRNAEPTPFDKVPREPKRLIDFLRQPTVLGEGINQTIIPGGIRDPGGDLRAILGGVRGRPGLINSKGRSFNDALTHAWENGYFPEFERYGYAPGDDQLLKDRIEQDHNGHPVYSEHDLDAVHEYQAALANNDEINRLATEHGIPTHGLTRDQFFDQVHDRMSTEELARDLAERDASDAAEYRAITTDAQRSMDAKDEREVYGQNQSRTLEDLEREYQQAGIAPEAEQHAAALEGDRRGAGTAAAGEEVGRSDRRATGPAGRGAAEEVAAAPGQAGRVAPELPLVEHTTKRGKVLQGVIRNDLSLAEAKALDPYTFKKNGGWFIRQPAAEAAATGEAPPKTEAAASPKAAVQDVADAERRDEQQRREQAMRLRALAHTALSAAQESLGRDRLTNTARRARMASSAEEGAARVEQIGKTLRNLADAIERGEVAHLNGVTGRAQVELLETTLRRAVAQAEREKPRQDFYRQPTPDDVRLARLPQSGFHATHAKDIAEALRGKKGFVPLVRWLESRPRESLIYPTPEQREMLEKGLKAVQNGAGPSHVKYSAKAIKESFADRDRFTRMGIRDDGALQQALAEYLDVREGTREADPIKAAERKLAGNKNIGVDFFPTPKPLVENLVREADIKPGMRVLEPSAGKGDIADELRAAGASVDTVEMSSTLREILAAKGHAIVGDNFDDFHPAEQYDRIVMNPPFSDRMDAAHVERAYGMLKPGGRLVAITGEGVFFGTDAKARQFREWLEKVGGSAEELPEGSFKSAFRPTGVATRMVVIDKPEAAPTADLLGRAVAAPRERAQEPTLRTDTRQTALPGTQASAVQAQAARDAQGRGALQTDVTQKPANEGLFAPDTSGQATLYSGPGALFDVDAWRRFFSPLPPKGKQLPPGGMFEPPQPPNRPPVPPEVEAARMATAIATKNLNPVERFAIFPRVLASLDERSARLWNAWQDREREASSNVDHLRGVIAPTFLKLDRAGRDHVAAALEVGRIAPEGLTEDQAGNVIARNTTVPFARWSKVGDTVRLTPEESRAFHEAVTLGDEQWLMLMRGAAKRYGWDGVLNPERIRQAAEQANDPSGHKKLQRLADLLDAMRQHQQDIYFPMQRFGSYFIAIRPKEGSAVVENLGGKPPLAWFETIEKPTLQDVIGATQGRWSVQGAAAKRIAELRQQFPADRFDIQQGDFARTPSLLRKIDIPAIEKLMMLMENTVQRDIRQRVMSEEGGPTSIQGVRQEAKSRYQALHGATVEAFYDALFNELKAGYRKRADVVPGYSADFDRAMGTHLSQIARNTADMVHRDAIESAYTELQDYHPHRSVANYWKAWRDYQDNPGNAMSRAANGISQVGYAYVMGMSPASTIIMASHTPMAAAPVLSVGVGPRVASSALLRGLGNAYRALAFDTSHGGHIDLDRAMRGMPPAKQAFLQKMVSEGKLASVGADDLGRLNERQSMLLGEHTGLWRRALDIATSNVHAVDQANRFAVGSAAWDIASDPIKLNAASKPLMQNSAVFRDMVQAHGLSPETFGRFMLSEAAFEWGKANRPPWQRSAYGTLVGSLHGFQTRYLSTAFRLMKNMGPEGRLAGLFMLGALFTGAGLMGLPGGQDIGSLIDKIWQPMGRPGATARLREFMEDNFGKVGATVMLDGPVSYLSGLDLGSRIGFGDVAKRQLDTANLIGTFPSILWNALSGAHARMDNDQVPAAVASEVAPYAARGALRALSASQQGVMTRRGKTVVPPEELGAGDIARMATGFQPLSVRQAQEERARIAQVRQSRRR